MKNTRTAPFEFVSHLRAWKSPRQISVTSGAARRVAHLAGDSPRRGAHGGRLGVSTWLVPLNRGAVGERRGSRRPRRITLATKDHPGVSNRGWRPKGERWPQTASWAHIYLFFCSLNNLLWIHVHGRFCFFFLLFFCLLLLPKQAGTRGGRCGLTPAFSFLFAASLL